MGSKFQVGVRYCGGCNPRYDRVSLVNRLKKFFPEADFVPAVAGTPYSAVLAVCGCLNRCADVSGLVTAPNALFQVTGFEDLLPVRDKLKAVLQVQESRSLTHEEILAILPHRPPMLLIDEAPHLVPGSEITAVYHVPPELSVFQGHFPGSPVLPGVYSVEALAQASDLMLLSLERYAGKEPLFMEIKNARFRRKVLPGDTLELHASLKEERSELGYALCRCQAFVEKELAVEAELMLAMR